jgi:hypothetical protein
MDEKRLSLRLPSNLHARILQMAAVERRSLNSQILYLLQQAVNDAALSPVGQSRSEENKLVTEQEPKVLPTK